MNKNELVTEMARLSGLSKTDSTKALDAFVEAVHASVARGDEVRLIGHGTYSHVDRKETTARSPRDGKVINVPATRVPKFKPGKDFKDAVSRK
jgi:DNA-binding protein HU-beta